MTNKAVVNSEGIVAKGPCAIVAYARRSNGKRPAKDYIENLQQSDQATLARSFKQLADTGKIWNTERFRKLRGKIGEFKTHPKARVLCFQLGKTWFLTHGFDKETGDTPPRQIERAEQIRKEHISLLT
ncbi:MAG: type II toxin-antitoxin system RelE/ParE family toxin [Sedimentisphaerales bacterium]